MAVVGMGATIVRAAAAAGSTDTVASGAAAVKGSEPGAGGVGGARDAVEVGVEVGAAVAALPFLAADPTNVTSAVDSISPAAVTVGCA